MTEGQMVALVAVGLLVAAVVAVMALEEWAYRKVRPRIRKGKRVVIVLRDGHDSTPLYYSAATDRWEEDAGLATRYDRSDDLPDGIVRKTWVMLPGTLAWKHVLRQDLIAGVEEVNE